MKNGLAVPAPADLAVWRTELKHRGQTPNVPGRYGAGGTIGLSMPDGDAIGDLARDDDDQSVSGSRQSALILATVDLPAD